VNEVTVTTMKGAFDLHPPLEVAVGTGRTWAEAKE
jgi:DNA polymerase I-like protein with 3'-5' exonuclease and polymerase domains